ncbi:MAG: hypothetical protein GXY79_10085, partial [Chloroflexi bacterium]|nr:hypothetical protein [Chloroflexota bacterium]
PPWQIVLSLALITLAALGTIHLMARLFRAQNLLSGAPLTWRGLLQALAR